MIKHVKRLLPAMLALLLAGCAAIPQDTPTSRYKVALIAKSTGLEFWNAVFTGAQAAATEYNIELTVTAPDDEEDFEGQNALIENAVEEGAKAIIFSAIDYEANAAAIDAAAQAGVLIINIDSQVNSDHVSAYIGVDNYGAGRMAAQSALDGVSGQLRVGLVNYEVNGANGRDRAAGACDAFQESGRAEVIATVQTHPNSEDARRDVLEMLRDHPEINVLVALNEPIGVGTARAVHQMQRADDLWLVAFDSNGETVDALQNGAVDALIVQNSYSMGYFGVQSAYKMLAGQGSSVETNNVTAAAVVTRDNMFAMDNQRELFLFE
ncbi:substrate-binding domain-containing protein [uncultured Gemmiger sp.]|uniref:substrate-binding domain-containing protein n=1 Tax=uncultured Gemmiger sp. TaxID=1623490 RepID=UPI0025CC4D15|nr:substrate-binding domain-containing protein [uncultured Gemmiger sp.]